jgi:hypothetical protein
MQIVKTELIDQRLFDFFMEDEKPVGLDGAATEFERVRHVAIDIDRLAVKAVAGEIWNVVLAIQLFDAPHDRIDGAVHHQAGDVPLRQLELSVRGGGMANIERHGVQSYVPRHLDDLSTGRESYPSTSLVVSSVVQHRKMGSSTSALGH